LRVASDRHRSQLRNRRDAAARLGALVADALRPRKARVSTTPTAGAKERRLHSKRVRSDVKRNRRAPSADD
jgi:ribosome-associated protein